MNFEKDVIEKSRSLPVVVDFWAPWCGPCQYLGPVIEELDAQDDRWELVKVNTDEHQDLMHRFGIRGIPAVKMFVNGEDIAEFVGALPKHEIQKWLDKHLPNEVDEKLFVIISQLNKDRIEALQSLQDLANAYPEHKKTRITLAKEVVWDDPEDALKWVEEIKLGDEEYEEAEDLKVVASFMNCDQVPEEFQEQVESIRKELQAHHFDTGVELLIEKVIMINWKWCDELPRKLAIAIFRLLGKDHEIAKKYRRRFDMALY